jgi:hypothetical protein
MTLATQLVNFPPAAMTTLARLALDAESAEIGAWHPEAVHGGLGVSSIGILRLVGTARIAREARPWSLVLKAIRPPAPDSPTARMELDEGHVLYWRREANAYQSGLLRDLPAGLVAPRCYGIDERPDGSVWLWLEDLHDAIGWPWPAGRYLTAAHDLGRFGGAYASGRPVPDDPWLCADHEASWFDRFSAGAAAAMRDETWANPLLQAAFPVPVADRTQRLITEHEAIRRQLARLPRVLCHHDSWSRNLFARQRNGREETVAVDWATVGPGPIGSDCGMLLAVSMFFGDLDPTIAARTEPAVFAGYLAGLREAGWQGDARLARFGSLAVAAYLPGVPGWLPLIETEEGRDIIDRSWGRPWQETLRQWAAAQYVYLDWADEARALLNALA